jgi:hypothetical protein
MIDFAGIEAREQAATQGPWHVEETEAYGRLIWASGTTYDPSDPTGQTAMQFQDLLVQQISEAADADFIAHAREDVPVLLGERVRAVTRLRELEQEAKAELRMLADPQQLPSAQVMASLEARAAAYNAAVDVVLGVVI